MSEVAFDELVAASETLRRTVFAGRLTPAARRNILHWLLGKGYAEFQPEVLSLVSERNFDELERCFWEVLPFGTGGRRGPMARLGSATINTRTVAESARGLAMYLQSLPALDGAGVVIACDTRDRSREFARLAASVLAAAGIPVQVFDGHRATPELSFAVRRLHAAAGIMISASHNPPSDNGIKVYWSHGGQVLPPHDAGILSAVACVEEIPRIHFEDGLADGRITWVPKALDEEYISAVCQQSLWSDRSLTVLYTPLHGVGETSVARVLATAGFSGVEIYAPHREPNGSFPNVPQHLANPELPSVFEGPESRAQEIGADLILASDPDADRLGAKVRAATGEYVYLSGNRIGALLADYVLRQRSTTDRLSKRNYLVTTLVTTPLIRRIAVSYDAKIVDDLLVGFKYVAETMDRLGAAEMVFAAEESLGYLAGEYCRDKDAALAALLLCELAAELRSSGKTLLDRLDELHRQHGYVAEVQRSVTRHGPHGQSQIRELMRRLRESPPATLAEMPLTSVRDYGRHEVRRLPSNEPMAPLPRPDSDLVILRGECATGELTLAVRPSGTEPKAKSYLFLTVAQPMEDLRQTAARAESLALAAMNDFWAWADASALQG